jgi:hypothetical protein
MSEISTLPRLPQQIRFSIYTILFGALCLGWLLPTLVEAQSITYSGPITITQGGTYTGNYQSLVSGVPCVRVNTTAPVVLSGCFLSGAGNLIETAEGADLTVRNCTGYGLTPTINDQAPGRFLDTYRARNLVVEHNIFSSTSGIVVNRWSGTGGTGQTLTVRYNQARNIDGRWRNGGSTRSSFLLLNTVQQLAGVEIAYNEVINTPDQSLVEDNINLYNSSGTAQSVLRVHDNFVRGAYPYPATSTSFSGTGMTTDGDGSTLADAAGYIEADHNQFVGTGNAAMNLAAGHDVYYHDNRAVTSGYLPDGRQFSASWAGLGVFNYYNQPASVFFNNRVENNTVGYVRWGSNSPYANRQDLSPGACAPCTGTISLPNPITTATEDAEWTLWQQKLLAAAITVGPAGVTVTPPVTTTDNTVINPGFELDNAPVSAPMGWQTQTGKGTNDNADYTETYPGAHTGTYHGTHYRPNSYEVYTYQTISGLASGTYKFSAWVKNAGGQPQAQLRAKNYGGTMLTTTIGATNGDWVQLAISNIAVSNGQCEIGFYSLANAGQALYFDDVEFTRQSTPPTVNLATATTLVLGQALALSATAADTDGTVTKVEFFAGTTKLGEASAAPYQLNWTPTAAGTYSLTARATDNGANSTSSATVTLLVTTPVSATPKTTANAINPGFELDGAPVGSPAGWQTWSGTSTSSDADYTETYAGAHSGTYHGTHYQNVNYEVYTYQTISGLATGTYKFSAWVKTGGGQQQAQMRARNYGGSPLATTITATTSGDWTLLEVNNINVSNGQCEIGFYSQASAGQWLYFDDVTFEAQSTANTLLNASFEDDQAAVWTPRQWSTQTYNNTPAYASYSETYGDAHTGAYHGTHYRPNNYEVYTYQTATNLTNGNYTLSAWVRCTGGQAQVQLQAKNYGGAAVAMDIPATPNQWMQVRIPGIVVSNGTCEIGFYSRANGGQWLHFDDVELVRESLATRAALPAATASAITATSKPTLYPNPATDQVVVTANFAQATAVDLVILDMQGVSVAKFHQQAVSGDNQFTIRIDNLPAGIYTLQIKAKQKVSTQRLEVQR